MIEIFKKKIFEGEMFLVKEGETEKEELKQKEHIK